MSDSYYDVAQICRNGHVINSMAHDYPQTNQGHCDRCGSSTIMACPSCDTAIRGHYHVPGVLGFYDFSAPAYCFKCGNPFPWTEVGLIAARELADTLDILSHEEREELKESLGHLLRDTPRTAVAETKFRKFMRKAGGEAYEGMKSILTDIVSETVRKSLFG